MKKFYKLVITAALLCVSLPAHAGSPTWVSADNLRARLIPAVKSIGDDIQIEAALDVELNKGWHTYWRVAGDAGLPPRFNWDASENVQSVETLYPSPKRKTEQGGFYTFGYEDRVTFPLAVTLKETKTDTTLNLTLDMMVCKDICIPERLELSLSIPAGDGEAASLATLINKAKEKVPSEAELSGLKIDTIVAGPDALVVSAYSKRGFKKTDIFATAPNVVLTLPPEITPDKKDKRKALIRIPVTPDIENLAESLKGQVLTITLVSGKDMIEKTIEY